MQQPECSRDCLRLENMSDSDSSLPGLGGLVEVSSLYTCLAVLCMCKTGSAHRTTCIPALNMSSLDK